jgi:hypothetical protein
VRRLVVSTPGLLITIKMALSTHLKPDENEKKILKDLVYSSVMDNTDKETAMEYINQCNNYETYQRILYRLEHLQPSIDNIANPLQRDINKHLLKIQKWD